jgi:hypothetical protein
MPAFATYTESSVNALKFNPKSQEVIERKQEIITSISQHHGSVPTSILFYGFSPLMLAAKTKMIAVTDINDAIKKYLDTTGIKYVYIKEADLADYKKQFSWVVASDEYFTFANSEQQQLDKIKAVSELAKDVIVTTLRDYKNQDFRDREFSQPLAVRSGKDSKIFLEYHDYDYNDKNAWKTSVYEMLNNNVQCLGPFDRRSMFFKQMAKFSIDAGAKTFYVHKNLMYKSLIKKNYEHVISISF